jgi:hypothetical protein
MDRDQAALRQHSKVPVEASRIQRHAQARAPFFQEGVPVARLSIDEKSEDEVTDHSWHPSRPADLVPGLENEDLRMRLATVRHAGQTRAAVVENRFRNSSRDGAELVPRVDPAGFTLEIGGLVENPLNWLDRFALVASGQANPPDHVTILIQATARQFAAATLPDGSDVEIRPSAEAASAAITSSIRRGTITPIGSIW